MVLNYVSLKRSYLFLLFCLCGNVLFGSPALRSQESLVEVLEEIGEKFQVIFTYDESTIADVKVEADYLSTSDFNSLLSHVLRPAGLNYKHVGERYYIIFKDDRVGNRRAKKLSRNLEKIQRLQNSEELILQSQNVVSGNLMSVHGGQVRKNVLRTINGVVSDQQGNPLIGATVLAKGTSVGTATDIDGSFSLDVSDAVTHLLISYTGFTTQEYEIGGQVKIDVVLLEASSTLDEIVVVGYGTQKKVNLTGAVESIGMKDIVSKPVGQASMALQGIAPGVTVTQNSGKPGSDGGTIRIRGIGTLGDSNPLVLVDGIPGNLNDIDVNEIENISVLKDAASASIYGSRAANGVILVTTRKAKDGEFSVNYRTNIGWQEPTSLMQKVSGYDHMVMINEAYQNVGGSAPFTQDYIDAYKTNAPSDEYPETNWHDVMLKDRALQQSHYLNVNSGSEKVSLLGSLSFMDQDGIMHSNFKRYNLRLNSEIRLKDNLQFNVNLSVINDSNKEPPQNWYWLARYPHNLSGKNEDGSWGIGWDGTNGWATLEDGGSARNTGYDVLSNIRMDWQPVKGLNFAVQVAPKRFYGHDKSFSKQVDLYYPDGVIVNPSEFKGTLTERYNQAFTNNYKALLEYSKDFGKHSFRFLGGWEAIDFESQWLRGFRDQFPLENYEVLDAGSTANQTATGSGYEWSLMSYFGRVNYNLDEKYLFEFNLRRDGSSRFAEEYKYGIFPSLSMGWRVTEEDFMSGVNWLDELKIRASWGTLGNQNIGNYPFVSGVSLGQNYVFGNDIPALGGALINGSNPRISWESTEMLNFGIDALFWKLNLTADYYIKNTSDILLELPVPTIAGLTAPYQNAGKVRNKGFDVRLQYQDRIGEFKYRIGGVFSDVRNEIVDLVESGPYIDGRIIQQEGYSIGSIFGLESLGYFQNEAEVDAHATQFGPVKPGDIKYKDQNGDGTINAEDRVVIGDMVPRYSYGLNLSAEYKGFDFSAFVQGVGKVDGYLDGFAAWAFYLGGTAQEWHKDHWSETNPDASYPRLTFNYPNNEQVSSEWVRSASYLRLKNLQVGYAIPKDLAKKLSLYSCRIYVSGQNLLTFDQFYDGFDPEAPIGTGTYYPMVKVFTFGLEANLK